jgi:predicted amidophosphoribosyltransferase
MNEKVLPRGSASGRPKLSAPYPKCARCGTPVDKEGELCEVCGPIVAARNPPKASVELAKQPDPAYEGVNPEYIPRWDK